MTKQYRADYKKTIWGSAVISADSLEEAKKKLDAGDIDEQDNKCDYDWEEVYED